MISQPTPCPRCGRIYKTVRGMSGHFRKFPDHKGAGPIGPDGFTRLAPEIAEARYNALEMARKADQAERRAEEAEFHVEQLRDARDNAERSAERIEARAVELATERDAALTRIARAERLIESWERDAPDHSNPVFIGRLRECLRRDPAVVSLRTEAEE